MKQIQNIHITWQQLTGVLFGNIILGFGCALLALSSMGNDPFTASTMALSTGFHMHLGTYQLLLNIIIFLIQLWCGRKYIGLGSIINFAFLGYIVEYSLYLLQRLFGTQPSFTFWQQLLVMLVALIVLTFGLAMYQVSALGVSPYDFLALKLSDRFPVPYFVFRIATDAGCILLILIAHFSGLIDFKNSHLGIGTIICAFFLGPAVSFFSVINRKWIVLKEQEISK